MPTLQEIARNAITLIDAQERINDWKTRVKDTFGTEDCNTPISILIPLQDLQNIVYGFGNLPESYEVTGARLYLTFADEADFSISGVLVPVGHRTGQELSSIDIILDVSTGKMVETPVDPNTTVSVYDFTHPCPPLGCFGTSELLTEQSNVIAE